VDADREQQEHQLAGRAVGRGQRQVDSRMQRDVHDSFEILHVSSDSAAPPLGLASAIALGYE
jgi:hypothetical protein